MSEEGSLKRQICEYLEYHDCLFALTPNLSATLNARRSKYMPKGWPDITGIWKGRPLFIEVKTRIGRVSKEQEAFLVKARELGAVAILARCLEDVISGLK